jgi:hypothetical protein
MKRFFLTILLVTGVLKLNGQINEIGVFIGGSNYIGDIGATTYINPSDVAIGVLYKWNKSPRHAYRFSLKHAEINGDDAESDVPGRNKRGLAFTNTITEFSAGLEFNFFDFNLHQMDQKTTPYIYTGISYAFYDGLFFAGKEPRSDAQHGTAAIPMIVGIKSNITPNLILGAEIGARYTFADDIDGSFPTNENLDNLKFGNLLSKDWYVFTGFTLTYTFGEKPCYCFD